MENKNMLLKSSMTFGAILGLISVVVSLLAYFTNTMENKMVSGITIIADIVIIYIGCKYYRDNYLNKVVSYGTALGNGVLIGLFASIIIAVYSCLLYTVIDPTLMEKMLNMAREKMLEKNPNMTDEQVDMALSITKKMMSPVILPIVTIIGTTFWAFIISLITSIFIKKQDNTFGNNIQ